MYAQMDTFDDIENREALSITNVCIVSNIWCNTETTV